MSKFASLFDIWDLLVLSVNLFLFIFSKRILSTFYHEPVDSKRFKLGVILLRVCNLLVVVAFTYYHFSSSEGVRGVAFKTVAILVILYLGYSALHFILYYIRVRYGKSREIEGKLFFYETYNSRLLSIFATIFVVIIAFVSAIQVTGYDSLLQAGGAIGVVGVFFALTQSAWAPDLFSGLIILNSGMVEVGDVIEFNDGDKTLGVVYKTKVFHTEILNVVNNHRIMIKNAKLREHTIHNLSKFASARGLRECLRFKIGYDAPVEKVRHMFEQAYVEAEQNKVCAIEFQYPLEIGLDDAGDFALEWVIYYYTKDVKQIVRTRQAFREHLLDFSNRHGISLATPMHHVIEPNAVSLNEESTNR